MTRPTATPAWATDATFTSGVETGLTPRLDVGAIRGQGILAESRLAARSANFLWGTHGDWIQYLDARFAANWPERASFTDATAVNSDLMLAAAPYNTLGPNAGPLYIAACLGTKHVAISPDGQRWAVGSTLANLSTIGGNIAYGLIAGVPNFVLAADTFNHLYTSPDGLGFTLQATTGALLTAPQFVYAPSLNRWVAASDTPYYASGTSITSWTAATYPGPWGSNSGGCKRVVWNGSLFVALPVNSYNKCLTSSDGITWTERTLPTTVVWSGLAYSATDQLWLAVSSNNTPAKSVDGITWVAVSPTGYYAATDLAVIGNVWCATTVIANGGGIEWSNDQGNTWNSIVVGNHDVATAGWKRIIAADNRFLVAHQTGSVVELALSNRAG